MRIRRCCQSKNSTLCQCQYVPIFILWDLIQNPTVCRPNLPTSTNDLRWRTTRNKRSDVVLDYILLRWIEMRKTRNWEPPVQVLLAPPTLEGHSACSSKKLSCGLWLGLTPVHLLNRIQYCMFNRVYMIRCCLLLGLWF